jgi:hypothetical protein
VEHDLDGLWSQPSGLAIAHDDEFLKPAWPAR